MRAGLCKFFVGIGGFALFLKEMGFNKNIYFFSKDCGHRLVKVRVGNLISHDPYSIAPIPWKGITIYPRVEDASDVKSRLEKFSRELRSSLRNR